ncbi:MAG: HEAT repeat domain-containing protein [Gemmatimonadales bacterium]
MKDEQDGVGTSAAVAGDVVSEAADRTFLLECRLDQLHSALQSARADADQARARLAESAAREADLARRAADLHAELAVAREEVAMLHRRLEHSEALRAETEGRLLEAGARDEAGELARLRREVRAERRRADASAGRLGELHARIEELTATRETLLTRVAEWQSLVRNGDPEAVDLSEFIAALRGDILELEHRSVLAAEREGELLRQLEQAGVAAEATVAEARIDEAIAAAARNDEARNAEARNADAPVAEAPTDAVAAAEVGAEEADAETPVAPSDAPSPGPDMAAALAEAGGPERLVEQLLRLGKSRQESAFYAIRRWATSPEPRVRAAVFEALGHHLEEDSERLEHHLRWGLADPDPRVRRRVVLAAATARGVAVRTLLEPLRLDPDPQVRRVIHEVLRRASSPESRADARAESRTTPDDAALAASAGSR